MVRKIPNLKGPIKIWKCSGNVLPIFYFFKYLRQKSISILDFIAHILLWLCEFENLMTGLLLKENFWPSDPSAESGSDVAVVYSAGAVRVLVESVVQAGQVGNAVPRSLHIPSLALTLGLTLPTPHLCSLTTVKTLPTSLRTSQTAGGLALTWVLGNTPESMICSVFISKVWKRMYLSFGKTAKTHNIIVKLHWFMKYSVFLLKATFGSNSPKNIMENKYIFYCITIFPCSKTYTIKK